MVRSFRYLWLDVFSRNPLQGNQLAVFTDARGLTDLEMQALARETGCSETTFVLPRDPELERSRGVRTRIFTLAEELDFAGHPTLGTATALGLDDRPTELALELNSGRIPVRFEEWTDRGVYGEMVQREPWFGNEHAAEHVAKALGVVPGDFDRTYPIQTVSTGNPFVIVPFRSLDLLAKLHPDLRKMQHYLSTTDGKLFYLVCRETVDPEAKLHARMLFPGAEDPATGSAAGPAAAWMVLHRWIKPDEPAIIEQGLEIKRASQMVVRAGTKDGKPTNVRVGGHSVVVMRGEATL